MNTTKTPHKNMVTLALTCLAASSISFNAQASDYPRKNVSLVSPFPPGGTSDLVARAISSGMESSLGRSVTVVNRAGAGGAVGAGYVASATPDAYTVGLLTATPLLLAPLTSELPYSVDDFDYICRAFDNPLILTASTSSEFKTLDEFIEYAQDDATRVRYYTASAGALQDVATTDFSSQADFDAVAIPLRGDQPAVQNLMSGVIDVALLTTGVVLTNPDGLRPIAVMSQQRLDSMPDIPTFQEYGYELYYSLWGAMVTPKGIPEDSKKKLEAACESAQQGDRFKETMASLNMPVVYQSGEEFEAEFLGLVETTRELLQEMDLYVGQ